MGPFTSLSELFSAWCPELGLGYHPPSSWQHLLYLRHAYRRLGLPSLRTLVLTPPHSSALLQACFLFLWDGMISLYKGFCKSTVSQFFRLQLGRLEHPGCSLRVLETAQRCKP